MDESKASARVHNRQDIVVGVSIEPEGWFYALPPGGIFQVAWEGNLSLEDIEFADRWITVSGQNLRLFHHGYELAGASDEPVPAEIAADETKRAAELDALEDALRNRELLDPLLVQAILHTLGDSRHANTEQTIRERLDDHHSEVRKAAKNALDSLKREPPELKWKPRPVEPHS